MDDQFVIPDGIGHQVIQKSDVRSLIHIAFRFEFVDNVLQVVLRLKGGIKDDGDIGGFGFEFGVGGETVLFLHLYIKDNAVNRV